jgi:hypothetical protein
LPVRITWTVVAVALLAYVALALARQNVSLRLGRLGWFAVVGLTGQAAMWPLGIGTDPWQGFAIAVALAIATGGLLFRRVWLLSLPHTELLARLRETCHGLFLDVDEREEGRLHLCHRTVSRTLRIGRLGRRYSWVIVPSAPPKNKIRLLADWLRKQFPGPIPRLRIRLNKE